MATELHMGISCYFTKELFAISIVILEILQKLRHRFWPLVSVHSDDPATLTAVNLLLLVD